MEIQVMIKEQFPLRERQYTKNGEKKTGRIIDINEKTAVVQIFGMSSMLS